MVTLFPMARVFVYDGVCNPAVGANADARPAFALVLFHRFVRFVKVVAEDDDAFHCVPASTMVRRPTMEWVMRALLMMQPSEMTAWSICAPLIFEPGRKRGRLKTGAFMSKS